MPQVRKRDSAKRDLLNQWVWYAENASIEIADRFLAAAETACIMLASQPKAGIHVFLSKPELHGMHRFPLGDGFDTILLFYFPAEDGIDLVRAVHGGRDLNRLLSEGFFG